MELTEITWILLTFAISLIFYLCVKLNEKHNYWKSRGIAHVKPRPIFGNLFQVITMKKAITEVYKDAYFQFPDERMVGIYEMTKPVLILRDPKLIERILIKDFQYFTDHPQVVEHGGIFANGLFQLKGAPWRSVRYKISPAFTSGKIKDMFNGMLECTDELLRRFDQNLNKDYNVREAIAVYNADVIANTVFGIQINDKREKEKFLKLGTSIFNTSPLRFIHIFTIAQFPKIANLLGFSILSHETESYFKNLTLETIRQRENEEYHRNDYTEQLLKLKQLGAIEVKSNKEEDEYLGLDSAAPTANIEISDILLAGQAFQFLAAGFDPLVATIIYVMYDICRFPEIQERLREHVKTVLDKHQGYSYACLKEMTYLEQCIQESLRLYPIGLVLYRLCTKKYYIPEEKLYIEKGQKVIIPTNALHLDPKYYPDPEVYNPERLPPNSLKSNFTYLPFGDGPRICIGIRYAMIVMKLGLAKILSNYKFTLSPKTQVPFELNKQSILYLPKTELIFNMNKI